VNQAITQMDEVTQQNAALVEQATAAAESMREQAGNLAQAVSVFKLGGVVAGVAAQATSVAVPAEPSSAGRTKKAAELPVKRKSKVTPGSVVKTRTGTDDAWEEF